MPYNKNILQDENFKARTDKAKFRTLETSYRETPINRKKPFISTKRIDFKLFFIGY